MLLRKRIIAPILLCVVLLVLFFGQSALTYARVAFTETPPGWPVILSEKQTLDQSLAAGVQVSSQTLSTSNGSQHVSLLDLDLSNPNVNLGVVQANDQIFSRSETVSSMANRTQAIAGINGDFFEINTTGAPINMLAINGEMWQSPAPRSQNANDLAVLGVDANKNLIIGHEQYNGTINVGTSSHALNAVNRYAFARSGGMLLATSRLGAMNVSGYTVALLKPINEARYTVTALETNLGTLAKLSDGQEALIGGGESGQWLQANLQVGSELEISQQITPDNDLQQAIGGGVQLIRDGEIPSSSELGNTTAANPLTAVGITQDGERAFLAVFDGREVGPDHSQGLTRQEMAGYLLSIGAYQALLFDGGGSSEMVARLPGQESVSVINTPSDGRERRVANSLLVYADQQAQRSAPSRYRQG
ncbi:phosphodiester glycosidase family protein [Ktedonospora formicarum]|uniref:Phosphodiester glycosidase domain-containing protein n=1 Tax=Ktedonospora formicarum TaxID=2778364 RepID=A0A8J3I128_9CHLR|nr:phosphodiester glycosidase family protein [Ktedonospora formicarum]GHO46851.1 hypothetical protein KSX_50140 [Ktedonospora formicarum]